MKPLRFLPLIALALSAPAAARPAPAVPHAAPTLAPDGLSIADARSGKARLVPFGIPRADAEHAVAAVQGVPLEKGASFECGAGTIEYTGYRDGLQLTFQDDQFVGWTISRAESPLRTAQDIGVGSTRQALDAAYDETVEDSSLGLLFGAGDGLTGTLDIDGIDGLVTNIWAGTVCLID